MLNVNTATPDELVKGLWQEFGLPATADDVEAASQRLTRNGEEADLLGLCGAIIAIRAEAGFAGLGADADDGNWDEAPLHKLIARDMGMNDDEAAQFYDLIGKGDY